ncbi:MAG: hypothetical protein ACTSV5_14075 [Promethearchaeota archaeon]
METKELYEKLKDYFSRNADLMRHLSVNACWEYFITEESTHEEYSKLHYYLFKKDIKTLEMTRENPGSKPDLILYFTEKAILDLIQHNPSADEYYTLYRNMMNNPSSGIEVDNRINKSSLKLLKLGYRQWQRDFKF